MAELVIFGGAGLVGQRLQELLGRDHNIQAPSSAEVDTTNISQVRDFLKNSGSEVVIDLVAYTKVDQAEAERDLAQALNTTSPGNIAAAAQEFGLRSIHVSTDYVHDGKKRNAPYLETDQPHPLNVYGATKYQGELAVQEVGGKFVIARIEMPFTKTHPTRGDIVRTFLRMLADGKEITAIGDQNVTPVFIDDVAAAFDVFIKNGPTGIYHVVSRDHTTPYDFARKIARQFGYSADLVKPTTFAEYSSNSGKALRPQYPWLDSSKFDREFNNGILHSVDESLELLKKQIDAK